MTALHPDLARYVTLNKARRFLKNYEEGHWGIFTVTKMVYYHLRPWLFFISMIANIYGIYSLEDFGLYDGSSLFLPLTINMTAVYFVTYIKHTEHTKLVASLSRYFAADNETWMITIKNKYVKTIWKLTMAVNTYNSFACGVYVLIPIILDFVLHYGFDYLNEPLYVPLTFTPFLGQNATWDAKYYAIMSLNLWHSWEMVDMIKTTLAGYAIITTYCLIQLVIFKESVKSLNLEGTREETAKQCQMIVTRHADMIDLNCDLKDFFGVLCAFQTLFTSLSLTLCLFTTSTCTNVPVVMANGSGFMFYFTAGLTFCYLGQLLENESEEVFTALYDLPWYRYSPAVRKDFMMMLRQARTPLIIDYHGKAKMNLDTFMEILSSTYSYFTLLQSLTE